MKVGILGTPVSSGNRGVMALGTSLVSLCTRAGCDQIVLFVGHREPCVLTFRTEEDSREVRVVNYRLSPRARAREHLAWIVAACLLYRALPWCRVRGWLAERTPWIAALHQMDLVGDIRGGDSFSDIYGWWRYLLGFLAAWTVILIKGSMVLLPQTYGPYRSRWTRRLARWLLQHSSVIVARDRESQRVAQELAGDAKQVWLCPDVAFALQGAMPSTMETDPPPEPASDREHEKARPIGVNVNGLMYNGGYTRANMFGLKLDYPTLLPRLVTALLQEHPGEVWLIPHTYAPAGSVESDPEACRRVRKAVSPELQPRVRIVTGEYDCREIKGIIGQCEFFVGSRMHASIAALSLGIPTVGIAYSRKFAGVFETVGMRDWVVDGREVENPDAVDRVLELYRIREAVRPALMAAAVDARRRLQETFDRLFRAAGSMSVAARAPAFRPCESPVSAESPARPQLKS